MENPLTGSFNRERTILTFGQRSLEARAAQLAVVGGLAMFLIGLAMSSGFSIPTPVPPIWWTFFGLCFAGAGLWAYLLFRHLRFDLRKRGYVDRSGSGIMVNWRRGSIDEVRCLEIGRYQGLLPGKSQPLPQAQWGGNPMAGTVGVGTLLTIRLWWHDPHRPPVVVEHVIAGAAYGYQDQRTMHFIGLAQAYAQALRVPLTGNI